MSGRQKWSSEDQRDIVILGCPESLLYCESDMAYRPDLIRRIPVESNLAVEIDLTWSIGYEFGQRFLHSLSSIRMRRVYVVALVES
ncbi:hypothetical protein Tco_1452842 [Tanacetum coccineum]